MSRSFDMDAFYCAVEERQILRGKAFPSAGRRRERRRQLFFPVGHGPGPPLCPELIFIRGLAAGGFWPIIPPAGAALGG